MLHLPLKLSQLSCTSALSLTIRSPSIFPSAVPPTYHRHSEHQHAPYNWSKIPSTRTFLWRVTGPQSMLICEVFFLVLSLMHHPPVSNLSAMSLLVVQASLTEVNIRQKKKITLTIFTPAISTESCWYLTPMMRWSLCEIVDKQNQTRAMVLINIQFLFRFGMKRKLWMIFDICHKADRLFLANKFYVITVFRRFPSEDGI